MQEANTWILEVTCQDKLLSFSLYEKEQLSPLKSITTTPLDFSKIEHLKPLYCDLPYLMEMELRDLSYKTGKLGKYYVAEYFISIKNEKNEYCYTDIHYFFIKVSN